ncbi:TVP38/TMEM64 family protein [Candidatus Woesearchaeota archaeon]|nr:MAG: TVP38/TMEM64 family protein [Candidatus Woesearchaeota archaeon]
MNQKIIKPVLLALIIGLIAYLFFFSGIDKSQLTVEYFKMRLLDLGALGPIIFIILYSVRPLIPVIPPLPIAIAVGFVYGAFLGTILVSAGALLAANLAFWLARFIGQEWVNRHEGKGRLHRVKEKIEKQGWAPIMTARFMLSWDLVSYACGISNVSYKDFMIGTLIPTVPLSFVAVFLGGAFSGVNSLSDVLAWKPLFGIAIFVVGMSAPWIIKYFQRKK